LKTLSARRGERKQPFIFEIRKKKRERKILLCQRLKKGEGPSPPATTSPSRLLQRSCCYLKEKDFSPRAGIKEEKAFFSPLIRKGKGKLLARLGERSLTYRVELGVWPRRKKSRGKKSVLTRDERKRKASIGHQAMKEGRGTKNLFD